VKKRNQINTTPHRGAETMMKQSQRAPTGNRQNLSKEPTEEVNSYLCLSSLTIYPQELIIFHSLLRSNNSEAKSAFEEFSKSQNKEQFYQHIINICRTGPTNPKQRETSSSNLTQNPVDQKRVCYLFREGKCQRGNGCKFEHVLGNQQPLPSENSESKLQEEKEPPREKKEIKPICHFIQTNGVCRKADRCRFLHPHAIREGNQWKILKPSEAKPSPQKNRKEVNDQKPSPAECEEDIGVDESEIKRTTDSTRGDDNDELLGRSLLQPSDLNESTAFPLGRDDQSDIDLDLDASTAAPGPPPHLLLCVPVSLIPLLRGKNSNLRVSCRSQ
jgi:hypothetical protein